MRKFDFIQVVNPKIKIKNNLNHYNYKLKFKYT